jgi:hypothetical protein
MPDGGDIHALRELSRVVSKQTGDDAGELVVMLSILQPHLWSGIVSEVDDGLPPCEQGFVFVLLKNLDLKSLKSSGSALSI